KTLLRSSSFYRLRQFPSYLCRQGSSDILQWVYTSRTKLSCLISAQHKQLRAALLTLSVYAALGVVCLQLVACVMFLTSAPTFPPGLGFLIGCVAVMGTLAGRLMKHFTANEQHRTNPVSHNSRSRIKQN
ncbi:hypothetical protein AAG570_003529, partial [Ranatra chinensis]